MSLVTSGFDRTKGPWFLKNSGLPGIHWVGRSFFQHHFSRAQERTKKLEALQVQEEGCFSCRSRNGFALWQERTAELSPSLSGFLMPLAVSCLVASFLPAVGVLHIIYHFDLQF